ncbi:uncharacterized protein LOC131604333 [Vicia villosa]|uniref:uncharacterized protein LOC131604333 n=1 Tax=Vicia villosa TaxID=3911 RepID=UPI00273C8F5A|nr:uncharacterized protein LOC131604333 [Vicia villosa]
MKVSELISSDGGHWKRDLIFSLFVEEDARQIINLPLSTSRREDVLCWWPEKSGEFSVKSAYHLCLQGKFDKLPGPSRCPDQKIWKLMWNAPVQPRIHNFLWRVIKDILPTRDNLRKKGIQLEDLCPFCHNEQESAQHLFIHCDFAKHCFFASVLCYRLPQELGVMDWLQQALSCGDRFSIQVLYYTLYGIWKASNNLIFRNKAPCEITVAHEAVVAAADFNLCHQETRSRRNQGEDHVHVPLDTHAVQVDAGVFPSGNTTFGCVVKNPEGDVIMAACKREELNVEPAIAEALAIRWCLKMAAKLKLERILVQSDCLNIVECINGVSKLVVADHIAADCRDLFKCFSLASVMFIPRVRNVEAHRLVKFGHSIGSRTWLDGVPDPLSLDVWHEPISF